MAKQLLRCRHSGFTLIEALIGAVVVTVLLVGIMFLMSKLFTLTVLKKNLTEINRLGLEGLDRVESLVRNQPWLSILKNQVGADYYYNTQTMSLTKASQPDLNNSEAAKSWLVPNTGSGYYRWAQLLYPSADSVYIQELQVKDLNTDSLLGPGDQILVSMSAAVANTSDITNNGPATYFSCTSRPERGFGEGAQLTYSNQVFTITLGAATGTSPLVQWGDTILPNSQTVVAAKTLDHDITLFPGPGLTAQAVTWFPGTIQAQVTVVHVDRGEHFTFNRLLTP